jgi:HEPN domain-containing protein
MRLDTQPWWEQALADLRSAEILLAAGQFYGASFFAQQCAEKALKALYIEQKSSMPPRTHDLELLASQVGALATLQAELTVLTPIFDIARYPDAIGAAPPALAIGEAEAQNHFEAAERILAWIGNQL